jgi:hypothetical protein
MAFSYTAGSTADRDRVRLEIGDTDEDRILFQDAELDDFLAKKATASWGRRQGLARLWRHGSPGISRFLPTAHRSRKGTLRRCSWPRPNGSGGRPGRRPRSCRAAWTDIRSTRTATRSPALNISTQAPANTDGILMVNKLSRGTTWCICARRHARPCRTWWTSSASLWCPTSRAAYTEGVGQCLPERRRPGMASSNGGSESLENNRRDPQLDFTLTVAYDQSVDSADRVVHASGTYEVQTVDAGKSWPTTKRCKMRQL